MRNGEAPDARQRQIGATYLLLLFLMAVLAASMAAVGSSWSVAAQREREAELLFRGNQFSHALTSWRNASLPAKPQAPLHLEELLVDERTQPPRHHLRHLYTDPFTGRPDWDILRDEEGRIVAVASASRVPAMRRLQTRLRVGALPNRPTVGDWLFEASPDSAPPPISRKPKR